MTQRPRHSTGFRLMLAGLAGFAIGIWVAFLAPAVGTPLVFGGLLLAEWFRFPRDWEKTWPDDFPRLARLAKHEPHPERWERTPSWWSIAAPRKRLEAALAITAASLALIVWTLVDPAAVY